MVSSIKLPDKRLCGSTDSILVFDRNLESWVVVSFQQYMSNAAHFVDWAYLPPTPEVGPKAYSTPEDVALLVRLAPRILVNDKDAVKLVQAHLAKFVPDVKEKLLRQFKRTNGGFNLTFAIEALTTNPHVIQSRRRRR